MKFILTRRKRMSDYFKGLFIRSYDREGREAFDKRIKIKNKIYYIDSIEHSYALCFNSKCSSKHKCRF